LLKSVDTPPHGLISLRYQIINPFPKFKGPSHLKKYCPKPVIKTGMVPLNNKIETFNLCKVDFRKFFVAKNK
tara:strand:+ start:303 stop:518 length:216 start_codon:yes stop_codon:yes gene_type:complete